MPSSATLFAFSGIALAMVLSPGPNMIYLISRSISQGIRAGLISLIGIALGFIAYMLMAIFGITGILLAVPMAFDVLRLCGVAYLLYLAWQISRSGSVSPIVNEAKLANDSPRKLLLMGFLTNLLNPKIALLYLALLPQFMDPGEGSVLKQGLILGILQISISVFVNGMIVFASGAISRFLQQRPYWARAQRWLMASVLAGLAARLSFQSR